MVASTVTLPNIRKMFIPDPGKIIIDFDLERADAQVVAWEADDENMKVMFREGIDIHTQNAKDIFRLSGEPTYEQRHKAKAGVHAVNYYVKSRTLAAALGVTVKEADDFINRWFAAHPTISQWHERIRLQLESTRTVSNKFGYSITFFERLDNLLPEALAWIPQSSVALVTNKGLINIDKNLPDIELLLQVHDSLVMQCDIEKAQDLLPKIKKEMKIVIPYDDPLIISTSASISDVSWGEIENIILHNNIYIYKKPFEDKKKQQIIQVWNNDKSFRRLVA